MQQFDYLIIGQGLAGTCLSLHLQAKGKRVLVVDFFRRTSSSRIAAGFIHPITGRRINKTWMAETLLPYASSFYYTLGQQAKTSFFHESDSLEMISEIRQLNDWQNRSAEPGYAAFFGEQEVTGYDKLLVDHIKLIRLRNSGWLNVPKLLDHYKQKWKASEQLLEIDSVINDELSLQQMLQQYGITATAIIFCEGEQGRFSEFWNWLPFNPAKGEILTLEIPGLPEKEILFNGIFFIPLGNHKFRVGSTYSWDPLDDVPTEAAKAELVEKIHKTIQIPFTIADHLAGVRPATDDRRPFLGRHPHHKNYFIFNGLGSKGSLLAPWFAEHLTDHLIINTPLLKEVDISRFSNRK